MRRRALASAAAAAALGLALTACGGDSTEAANSSVSLAGSQSTTVPPAADPSAASSVEASAPAPSAGRTTADTATPAPGTPPADRVQPGAIVSGEGFLRPGSGTDYQFAAGDGKWTCVMTQEVAGCTGELASGGPARSDGVAVTSEGKSAFAPGTAEDFAPSGAAKELPTGRSLPNGTFVCTAFEDGIQCETTSGAAGFKLTDNQSVNW